MIPPASPAPSESVLKPPRRTACGALRAEIRPDATRKPCLPGQSPSEKADGNAGGMMGGGAGGVSHPARAVAALPIVVPHLPPHFFSVGPPPHKGGAVRPRRVLETLLEEKARRSHKLLK